MQNMAYYLFSSILQADAAIVGLSAIFVIYRLQSFDTQFQNAYAILSNAQIRPDFDYAKFADNILLAQDIRMQIGIFSDYDPQIAYRKQFELIIMIPELSAQMRRLARLPMLLIGSHMAVCALLILGIPTMNNLYLLTSACIIVLSFILILAFIGARALKLVEGQPNYSEFLRLMVKQGKITEAHINPARA